MNAYRATCNGWVEDSPDYRIHREGVTGLLRFYVTSSQDTTLLISDPNGNWYCRDDSYDTRSPTIDFSNAPQGRYDIWVGSIHRENHESATLHITEVDSNHP
ncbi:hypothetical protein [Polyangium mundeleinium]|uniref:Uncharacterized protein n=1 Tax=Polyangium mundeleinium TaxID=2995306 RepID=A0ABT5EZH4_9BACT|nr:hypothetical protein [Polyangium mundeleinium]MDC0747181.1 hypothetical protein [Polyangium mundeleinium]